MSLLVKDLPDWKLWSECPCIPPVGATCPVLRVFDLSGKICTWLNEIYNDNKCFNAENIEPNIEEPNIQPWTPILSPNNEPNIETNIEPDIEPQY